MLKHCSSYQKAVVLLLVTMLLTSHNLYVKLDRYVLAPGEEASLSLFNGSFEQSENIITRDRMIDASVMANGERIQLAETNWVDLDSTVTGLKFTAGNAGTYVVGVSTKAREIELSAEKFNNYLKHDGILDELNRRTTAGLLETDAVELYEKHVKAIYQVGKVRSNDWQTPLGYPIEFVPLANPYEVYSGESLKLQLLLAGQPLANQLVYADYSPTTHEDHHHHTGDEGSGHTHDHSSDAHHEEGSEVGHEHPGGQQLRTNEEGLLTVDLPEDGVYFLRAIHMTAETESPRLTHHSKWATLTFAVSHHHGEGSHSHGDHNHPHHHGHNHDHHHEDGGIPTWVFLLGSVVLVGMLFFAFRSKS